MRLFNSCIYSGFVTHRRFKPKRHFFTYKTFSLLIDLHEIENLEKNIKFFSYNKFNILSFYDRDHGPRDGSSLVKWVKNTLNSAKIDIGSGTIKLLCYPRFFGYVFNPLSIFYCYDENLQLKAILYEVKNTFNEQHTYVFPASSSSNLILHRCDKKFSVSPFMEMKTFYNFRLLNPRNILNVFIKFLHKEPSPGPSSTNKIFFGLPICSQNETHQIANISPKRFEIIGAVIKSPSFPNGLFFM